MTSPIPTDKQRRLHVAVITAAAVVAVLMVGAAAWTLTRPKPPHALPVSSLTTPLERSASAVPTTSAAATLPATSAAVTPTTAPATTARQPVVTHASVIVSAHKIAYRVGGALFVAKDDGTMSKPVYGNGTEYALSPDGVRVASVEGGKLAVVAVGTRPVSASELRPGTDCQDTPVWTPDSSAVMFIRTGSDSLPSVWRYSLGSDDLTRIGAGSGVAISPNGRTIVALPTEATDSGPLRIWRTDGGTYTVKAPSGDPLAVALTNDRIYVSTVSGSGIAALWSMSLDGKQYKKLASGTSAGSASGSYGHVLPSPDGKHVMYTVDGDDGYSRIRMVASTGGASIAISGRRDGYPVGWTADSAHILFIEGNSIQDETTALWRSDIAGHNRKMLVKNATL